MRMMIELVFSQVFLFNFTIPEDYISKKSLRGIVTGVVYDYNKICGEGTRYGEYVQRYEKIDNTMRLRTVSAICIRPTGNVQGSFYYYSLVTGRRLHRRKYTPIPIPDGIIDRVHDIATQQ